MNQTPVLKKELEIEAEAISVSLIQEERTNSDVTLKLEFEDEKVPYSIIQEAIRIGLEDKGYIFPAGMKLTLDKRGIQEDGSFLAYVYIKMPDASLSETLQELDNSL